MSARNRTADRAMRVATAAVFLLQITAVSTGAYTLGSTVGDMRQSASVSGGTACPQYTRFDTSAPGSISRRWSTMLGSNPVTILTSDQTTGGQLNEIEAAVQQSLSVWTSVSGVSLTPATLAPLQRTSIQAACNSIDGINSVCFDQSDAAFATGVLAFTRTISADVVGEQLSVTSAPSTFVGEILDADVYLRPGDSTVKFATPAALPANPNAYDLESILTHELGHTLGFSHSGVWRAMMYPFAPPPGQFTGTRPTPQAPDAPLSDDDRTGLRLLYPSAADTVHVGAIRGRVLPANALMLAGAPNVTGIYGAQVVALDGVTGDVVAAAVGGWSCSDPGPARFDGSYSLDRLPVSTTQSYEVYAEPFDGAVPLTSVINSSTALCRNSTTDPGWPAQYACTVPAATVPFSVQMHPGP